MTFEVGGYLLSPTVGWNNGRLREVALEPIAPPEALDDIADTAEDTAVSIGVLTNDRDPDIGDSLTVVLVGWPVHGSATTDGSTVTYTPTVGFQGYDQLVYVVGDGLLMDIAVVTIGVDVSAAYQIYLPLVLR